MLQTLVFRWSENDGFQFQNRPCNYRLKTNSIHISRIGLLHNGTWKLILRMIDGFSPREWDNGGLWKAQTLTLSCFSRFVYLISRLIKFQNLTQSLTYQGIILIKNNLVHKLHSFKVTQSLHFSFLSALKSICT